MAKTFFEPHHFLRLQKLFSKKDRGGGTCLPSPPASMAM